MEFGYILDFWEWWVFSWPAPLRKRPLWCIILLGLSRNAVLPALAGGVFY